MSFHCGHVNERSSWQYIHIIVYLCAHGHVSTCRICLCAFSNSAKFGWALWATTLNHWPDHTSFILKLVASFMGIKRQKNVHIYVYTYIAHHPRSVPFLLEISPRFEKNHSLCCWPLCRMRFRLKYLSEFEVKFKTALEYETGPMWVFWWERKVNRETVPLTKFICWSFASGHPVLHILPFLLQYIPFKTIS
jgi:hypothetical protein